MFGFLLILLHATDYGSFKTQLWLFKNATLNGSCYTYTLQNGDVAYFSCSPEVQARVFDVYDNWRPAYGILVALEPQTGRVIALLGYNRADPDHPYNKNLVTQNTFPAASIFKIVTALAAIRKLELSPEDSVDYRGKPHSTSPRVWLKSKYTGKCTFSEAFGWSNNPAFGALAKEIGTSLLVSTAQALGFVKITAKDEPGDASGLFGSDILPGTVIKPRDRDELMLAGAGFMNSTLSPLHGALLAASVANAGVMLKPSLVDSVVSKDGTVVWRARTETLAVVMTGAEAGMMKELFLATVACGTSYRAFYDETGKPVLDGVTAGGKTGTLTSRRSPEGKCEWFVGFGQDDESILALASLVINTSGKNKKARLKGSYPAEEALEAFMGLDAPVPACALEKPVEKKKK